MKLQTKNHFKLTDSQDAMAFLYKAFNTYISHAFDGLCSDEMVLHS